MDTNFDWISEYYQWIKKNLSARNLKNGWTEIGTPFMDRHNDGLVMLSPYPMTGTSLTTCVLTESLCAVLNEPSF